MTKLSFTLAIATLTVSLAPSAHAYGVAPEADGIDGSTITQINVLFGAAKQTDTDICTLEVTPVLANALGLSSPAADNEGETVSLASCEAE